MPAEALFNMTCGNLLVTPPSSPADWLVTWLPHSQDDENYPGFTMGPDAGFPTSEGEGGVRAWAEQQPWSRTCLGTTQTAHSVDVWLVGVESAEPLGVPTDEFFDLQQKAARAGWTLAAAREPDGGFSWAIFNAETKQRIDHGRAEQWDDALLAMVEQLVPPSDEA